MPKKTFQDVTNDFFKNKNSLLRQWGIGVFGPGVGLCQSFIFTRPDLVKY